MKEIPSESNWLPMSFREKSAWASLLAMLVAFVPYFVQVARSLTQGSLQIATVLGAFVAAMALQIALAVIMHIMIALRTKEERKDERDVAIASKSYKHAYVAAAFSVMLLIGCLLWDAFIGDPRASARLLTPLAVSQLLFACFVLSEATRYATQAICYRRGS